MLEFRIVAVDAETKARAGELVTPHGVVETPVFMPVGTQATVKTLAPSDLVDIGARIILSNAYHLYLRPGTELIREAGGLHRFMGWDRAILTDSGGFQIFSLARLNRVTEDGLEFQSHLDGSRHFMTPEQNVAVQRDIGADIIMALDECVAYPADTELRGPLTRADAQVGGERLLCRVEGGPARAVAVRDRAGRDLRRPSTGVGGRRSPDMDFPGYAIGGLAVGEPKSADARDGRRGGRGASRGEAALLHGAGIPGGHHRLGRAGRRHVRLRHADAERAEGLGVHVARAACRQERGSTRDDHGPMDPDCDCYACRNFSRGYIRHLFAADELLAGRLATLHSLTFYVR